MGFFSQNCHDCGHPLICQQAVNADRINEWMTQGVSISPNGDIHTGEYDGYGHIGGAEEAVGFGNTVYHLACWEVAGKPLDFKGESPHAEDQGWFFDDEDHAVPDPRLTRTGSGA